MSHQFIRTNSELAQFCESLGTARRIAFDTEFVSEYSYRSELCLIQVAASREDSGEEFDLLAVIDPLSLDVAPFWTTLAEGQHQTIVHAGREELVFSLRATGKSPANLTDVQLAAAFAGMTYPAGYGNLVAEILGKSTAKGETRTDWRRRPLSTHQVEYALDDVLHLLPVHERLKAELAKLGRWEWLQEELSSWQTSVVDSLDRAAWRKLSGAANLRQRELAVLRELWHWRNEEAERRNQPVRRVVRDDLIVELARRRTDDPQRIQAVRGFERRDYRQLVPAIAQRITTALATPDEELPKRIPRREGESPQRATVVQLLGAALSAICRDAGIAPNLVGTASDVRNLVADHFGERNGQQPSALVTGWRAEIVGRKLNDLLNGQLALRIGDANADQPLIFEDTAARRDESA